MKKYVRFDLLVESQKLLRGEKLKVSQASLLHALAGKFVEAAKKSKG